MTTERLRTAGVWLLLFVVAAFCAYDAIAVGDPPKNDAVVRAVLLPPPSGVVVDEASATSVRIGWMPPPSEIAGSSYEVFRTAEHLVCHRAAPSCLAGHLVPGTVYRFSVETRVAEWRSAPAASSFTTLSVATTALRPGRVGSGYDETLSAVGGTGARTWSLSAGVLPPGLHLDTASGTISGRPIAPGGASGLVFTVTDAKGFHASSVRLSIVVDRTPST